MVFSMKKKYCWVYFILTNSTYKGRGRVSLFINLFQTLFFIQCKIWVFPQYIIGLGMDINDGCLGSIGSDTILDFSIWHNAPLQNWLIRWGVPLSINSFQALSLSYVGLGFPNTLKLKIICKVYMSYTQTIL